MTENNAPRHSPGQTPKRLVVAHYNESLDWIHSISCPVLIYTRAEVLPMLNLRRGSPPVTVEQLLPNIGRESFVYLHHIVSHYDSLADLTLFTQGAPYDHVHHFKEYAERVAPGEVEFLQLATAPIQYAKGDGSPHIEIDLRKYFETHFDCPVPDTFRFIPHAIFAVSRERIHRYPRSFYEQLKSSFIHRMQPDKNWSNACNPQEGHCMERLWDYLFGAAYYPCRLKPD
jgi:hypothetical protein